MKPLKPHFPSFSVKADGRPHRAESTPRPVSLASPLLASCEYYEQKEQISSGCRGTTWMRCQQRSVPPAIACSSGYGRQLFRAVAMLALALLSACAHSPPVIMVFRTEQQAQQHCPNDTIVWLDSLTGNYYLKASGSYGRNAGRYACRSEADSAGMHQLPD